MTIKEIISTGDKGALQELGYHDTSRALSEFTQLKDGPFGEMLDEVSDLILSSPSRTLALGNLERLCGCTPEETLKEALKLPETLPRLITLCGSSQLLSNTLCKREGLFKTLFLKGEVNRNKTEADFHRELRSGDATKITIEADEASRRLRIYKQSEYVRIGLRDLVGMAPVEEVTAEIADLASASLDYAVEIALAGLKARFGDPLYADSAGNEREAEFTVIGMGKLGGRELNFSSDIDIIYLYSTAKGETTGIDGNSRSQIDLHSFFVKLAEKVSALINEITDEGNVFRVDLDLRPEGRSGEIVSSLGSAELYYESWGRTWERSAMIKARPVAGSITLGNEFLEMIEPFVYRKYLDFTAIDELKSMKERLDIELLRRNPDTIDVKLGAGGIREIEFFCQALLLIHGGRITSIREKNTLRALELLTEAGLMKAQVAQELKKGYIFLRRVEHRVQIIEGRQTHTLPVQSHEVERIAKMMGHEDGDQGAHKAFMKEYRDITGRVYDIYRTLFYESSEELGQAVTEKILVLFSSRISDEEATTRLTELGFEDKENALESLKSLKDGPTSRRITATGRLMLEKIAPFLLQKTTETPDPDKALSHLARFLDVVAAKTTFYALINENPKVAELLVKLFGTSEFLSKPLLERPGTIDHLLSRDLKRPIKNKEELKEDLQVALLEACGPESGAYEDRLDAVRRFKSHEVFRIGINDILGNINIEEVTGQFTSLAEIILEAAIDIAGEELNFRYGAPGGGEPEKRFGIIGLGKLGSRELIYGSDLDIVFVYSDQKTENYTSGPKEISNHEYFVKLGQRIISVLTLKTREGHVFDVDMRLRPSGSSGPLVVTKNSMVGYQKEKAEVWEAQAMLKARAVAGDMEFASLVVDSIKDIIFNRGLEESELAEIRRIRARMENEIAKEGACRYNIKTGLGGSVDIETTIQVLQLKNGPCFPSLRVSGTLKSLDELKKAGLLEEADYVTLTQTAAFYKRIETMIRVVHDKGEGNIKRDSKELTTLAKRLGYCTKVSGVKPQEEFLNDYLKKRAAIRALYERIVCPI